MRKTLKLKAIDIAQIGLMVAIIEVCKIALQSIPNVETTTFWLIIFTIYLGYKVIFVVPIFILIEGAIYGIGLWWIMYLYIWPLLIIVTILLRKPRNTLVLSVLSGMFGLLFGFLCSFPYFFIGWASGDIKNGVTNMFTWWIAGIPFDILHGIANFVIMLCLHKPISKCIKRVIHD